MSISTWVLSIKVILISAGVASLAVGLKSFIPVAVTGVPAMWSVFLSWLEPPYLYIIINGIIITIAASSRFHQSQSDPPAVRSEHLISVKTPPPAIIQSLEAHQDSRNAVEEAMEEAEVVEPEVEERIVELTPVIVNGSEVDITTEEDKLVQQDAEDAFIDSTLTYNTPTPEISFPEIQLESLFPVREKPLASSRFVHRRPNRNGPHEVAGVWALRVAKPRMQETLESTWKMITEGRHVPLTRHLKKSDTWEHHVAPTVDQVPKSETFKERGNYAPAVSRIRKEPSLSQDELNRRVEAFIKKFNEDMRLQRQESLNQYMEMINRGV